MTVRDPIAAAVANLAQAEKDAEAGSPTMARLHAAIGHGYAVLAQTSQQHLLAQIAQYQALCTLAASGVATESLIKDMRRLEPLIQKGLGL